MPSIKSLKSISLTSLLDYKETKMRAILGVFLLLFVTFFVTAENPEPLDAENVLTDSNKKALDDGTLTLYQLGNSADSLRKNANGLICYTCVGCNEITTYTPTKICPYTNDFSKNKKCVSYVEKYPNLEPTERHVRGCSTERGSCADLKRVYQMNPEVVQIVSCDECEGDRCNKSSLSHTLSGATITFFLIISPLLKKCLLA